VAAQDGEDVIDALHPLDVALRQIDVKTFVQRGDTLRVTADVSGLKPNAGKAVTIPLQPTAWTVPSGDHVALVIDTVDDRYTSLTKKGAKVTAGSDPHHPATLVVPSA